MTVHAVSGLTVLVLLVFRILWGVVGSTSARFRQFVTRPSQAAAYLGSALKGQTHSYLGHDPAGGLMVILMLAILTAQVLTGLLANNELGFSGPLADHVSREASDAATVLHARIFNLIIVVVWLHLVAIFFYLLVRGENLILPMLTGRKCRQEALIKVPLQFAGWKRTILVLMLSGFVLGVVLFV